MRSTTRRLLGATLILLTGCSSSGIFSGRTSRGKDSVSQAFETQRDAARDDRTDRPLRRADAPVARTSTQAPAAPMSNPADTRVRLQIAEALAEGARAEKSNDAAGARSAYEKVLTHEPHHAFANYQLAVIADNEGRFTEAERHYQTLLRKSPRNADLLASLGWSYLLQGRYEESERTLREALAIDAKHRTARYNLGWLYGTLGDYDQALSIFRSAGSDEDAQRAMAELFPKGRPAVTAQLSSGLPRNPFVSEAGGMSDGRRRNVDQFASGQLSAPAPWQRAPGTQVAGNSRESSMSGAAAGRTMPTADVSNFEDAFAQLEGGAGTIAAAGGVAPRIGGVVQAGGNEQPLAPPPGHNAPVITPRSGGSFTGSNPPGRDAAGNSFRDGNSEIPVVGELTAGPTSGNRRNGDSVPDWPHRERPSQPAGAMASRSPGESSPRRPTSVAAQVGLCAGPGGLLFPLAPPTAVALSQFDATQRGSEAHPRPDQWTSSATADGRSGPSNARW